MNINQINALKKLLARKRPSNSSDELDAKILLHAKEEIESNKNSRPLLNYLMSPLSQVGNALGAVALTLICFLSMAKITMLAEPQVELKESVADYKPAIKAGRSRHTSFVATRPDLNANAIGFPTPLIDETNSDAVLLQLRLPSVPDLIESMEFVAERDRSEATIELIAALADINFLIDLGRLDDARDRYFDLLSKCYLCELPTSLEALAIHNFNTQGSG